MQTPADALIKFDLFQSLEKTTYQHIAEVAKLTPFKAGDLFYQQGAAPSGLFCVESGRIKLFRQSGDKMQILALLAPGDLFGGESIATQAPCPYSAQALTAGTALLIPPADLTKSLDAHPDFLLAFLGYVSQKLRQFTGLVCSLAFQDVSTRLARILLQHDIMQTPTGLIIPRTLSQQDLAAAVGTAREVIYRTLKKFEQQGLLHITADKFILLDPEKMADLAQQEF
jgi:CRP-like cAMP-binding protein